MNGARDSSLCDPLLSLLSWLWLSLGVAGNVGKVSDLPETSLGRSPSLSDCRWHVLAVGNGITASSDVSKCALDKGALVEASAEEDSVDADQDPSTLLKDDGRSENAEPKSNLKDSNEGHGGIIVILDKATNGVGKTGRVGLLTSWSCWLWLQDWQEVRSCIGSHVEDGVDGEWKNGKWCLASKEPDQGHY